MLLVEINIFVFDLKDKILTRWETPFFIVFILLALDPDLVGSILLKVLLLQEEWPQILSFF